MRMLIGMYGVTRMYTVKNEFVRGRIKMATVTEELKGTRRAKRRDETHVTKSVLNINLDGWRGKGV